MFGIKLCSPALIYLVFSLTQVVVDSIKGLYNVALLKFTMMVLFTLLLNILCERGLSVISWIIVFVPFILMSVITSILLFIFGLDPTTGKIHPKHHIQNPSPIHSKKQENSQPEDIYSPTHITNVMEDREKYVRKAIGEDLEGLRKHVNTKNVKDKLDQTAAPAKTDAHHLLGKAKSYMKDVDSYL